MARYRMNYDDDFDPGTRDRYESGRSNRGGEQLGGMRSDGWGSDWQRFPGEEGWYGGRGYDRGFRGGMEQVGGWQGGMRDYGHEFDREPFRGGYGGRDMGYGGGSGSRGWEGQTARGGSERSQMRAVELMTENPEVVTPDASLADVARRMRDMDVGIIPVVEAEDNRRLRGVITDRDIAIRAIAEGKDGKAKVAECMTEEVESVNKNDPIETVLQIMKREQVRRVPVTDREGRLVGIIAQADLALEYSETSHRRLHKVQDTIERISEPSGKSQRGGRQGADRMAAGSRQRGTGRG
jgi:CBS domain-containing protein